MKWLIAVTCLWAFSFSLIGEYLAGEVDSYVAVLSRTLLALVVFIPFVKLSRINWPSAIKLMLIGAVQIGLMYLFFYHSFLYLSVAEVLLFTILTPVYVSIIDDLVFNRKFHFKWLSAAVVSVIGAAIIRYHSVSEDFYTGLLLVQLANICFAFGQVAYKRLELGSRKNQQAHFLFFFLGASLLCSVAAIAFGNFNKIPDNPTEVLVILWLGLIASGVGYFCWNYGAKQVNTGQLATMNNALIPVGLLVNVVIWQRNIDWLPLLAGGSIILISVIIASNKKKAVDY
ncbi:DMT family transporter [Pleionea sediminis]|uniref:DMT family transporter n=1 Tax=Pleionea sediminis TaxID=2569479 RepID=UPI0011855CD6|nr:DMT family transporter [Pleionea sediminis]